MGSVSLHSFRSMLIFMQQHEGTEQNRRKGIAGSAASEQEGEDSTGWERLTLGLQLVKAENQVDTLDKGCDFCLQGKEMATAFHFILGFLSYLVAASVGISSRSQKNGPDLQP